MRWWKAVELFTDYGVVIGQGGAPLRTPMHKALTSWRRIRFDIGESWAEDPRPSNKYDAAATLRSLRGRAVCSDWEVLAMVVFQCTWRRYHGRKGFSSLLNYLGI